MSYGWDSGMLDTENATAQAMAKLGSPRTTTARLQYASRESFSKGVKWWHSPDIIY